MLTNFPTIRKAVKKMSSIDKMGTDGTFDVLSKRERLQITRQRAKLEKNLGSISDLTRLPAAMFIVDVHKEYIAVREANRLNIPVFAMVDTNSDPRDIDFPIPSNDDASKSISLIMTYITAVIAEGLSERKMEKEKDAAESKKKSAQKDEKREVKKPAAKDGDAPARERQRIKGGTKVEKTEAKVEKPEAKVEKPEAKVEKPEAKNATEDVKKVEEKTADKAEAPKEEKKAE
jgi:small subunit ribosomal protein S2